jgi:hypothetical protein
MEIEDRIRIRAYYKWLKRQKEARTSEVDDWLAAESEELALELVDASSKRTLPEPSFTQDDLWFGSEQIAKLFDLLKPPLRKKRARSHLLSMIDDYQDYLTSSAPVSDDEAERQGKNALLIFRLLASLTTLIGDNLALTAKDGLCKELKDLFSEDRAAFDTAEFNVFSAAVIQQQTGFSVSFISEGDETTPDLRAQGIAYVECKDIHTTSKKNIDKTFADNLGKARRQLSTAQRRQRLAGTGVCIDVPWDMLPLELPAWNVVREALSAADGPQFVLLTSSKVKSTKEAVCFPIAVCLVWSGSGKPIFEPLLRRLTRSSHKMQHGGFDVVSH